MNSPLITDNTDTMNFSRSIARNPLHTLPYISKIDREYRADHDYDSAFLEQIDTGKHYMIGFKAKSTYANQYDGFVREQEPLGWAFYSYNNIDNIIQRLGQMGVNVKYEDITDQMQEVFYIWEAKKPHIATNIIQHNPLSIIPIMNDDVVKKVARDHTDLKEKQMFYQQYRLNHKGIGPTFTPMQQTHRIETESFYWS